MAQQSVLSSLREGNRDRLLAVLREQGPLHRAELARRVQLSRSTVSSITSQLLQDDVLVEVSAAESGHESSDRRGDRLLTINGDQGIALGMDFGTDQVRVALANAAHEVVASDAAPIPPAMPWEERLELGLSAANRLTAGANVSSRDLRGVGLGIPDPIDLVSGTVVSTRSDSRPWTGVRAADECARRLGVPVYLDNASHLATIAEVTWGAGRGVHNSIYVKMSNGVGAGFFLNGRFYRGTVGAAGEIGHFSVDQDGPACPCGNRGCLELYAGSTAILDALRPLYGQQFTLDQILDAVRNGDRACRRVVEDAGRMTGHVLANVCNLLNPELIIIGGELAAAGDVLIEPMRDVCSRYGLSIANDCMQIVPAALGYEAGVLGGVATVLRQSDQTLAPYRAEPQGQKEPSSNPRPREFPDRTKAPDAYLFTERSHGEH